MRRHILIAPATVWPAVPNVSLPCHTPLACALAHTHVSHTCNTQVSSAKVMASEEDAIMAAAGADGTAGATQELAAAAHVKVCMGSLHATGTHTYTHTHTT